MVRLVVQDERASKGRLVSVLVQDGVRQGRAIAGESIHRWLIRDGFQIPIQGALEVVD